MIVGSGWETVDPRVFSTNASLTNLPQVLEFKRVPRTETQQFPSYSSGDIYVCIINILTKKVCFGDVTSLFLPLFRLSQFQSFQFKNLCSCKVFQMSGPHSGIGSQAKNTFRSACRVDKNMNYRLCNVQHKAYKLVFTCMESDTILTCCMFWYWILMWKLDFNILPLVHLKNKQHYNYGQQKWILITWRQLRVFISAPQNTVSLS